MMRRYLALMLTTVFVLTSFGIAFADSGVEIVRSPFTDVSDDSAAARDFALLKALEIFEGSGDGTVNPEGILSRVEFAKVVVAFMNRASTANTLSTMPPDFTDTIPDWARGWVNAAHSMGIIQGRGDGIFDASAPVTMAEAATMLVRALGYETGISGPWPAAHVAKAAELGITDGVSISYELPMTREEMAIMAANALDVVPADGDGEEDEDKDRLLEEVFDFEAEVSVDELDGARIQLGGDWYDFSDPVSVFGSSELSSLDGNTVDYYAKDGEVRFVELTETNVIAGTFARWRSGRRLELRDGRVFDHVSFGELEVSVNEGAEVIPDASEKEDYVDEDDRVRLHLDADDEVELIDAYFDTFEDVLLTDVNLEDDDDPEFGDVTGENAAGEGSDALAVSDETTVLLNGEEVTLADLEEGFEEFRDDYGDDANAIASARLVEAAHGTDLDGAEGELSLLSVITDRFASGEVTARGSDYVRVDGERVGLDTDYLPASSINIGRDTTFLLGHDDEARVQLRAVAEDEVYFARLMEYSDYQEGDSEADVLLQLADGSEVELDDVSLAGETKVGSLATGDYAKRVYSLDAFLDQVVVITDRVEDDGPVLYDIEDATSLKEVHGYGGGYDESTETWIRIELQHVRLASLQLRVSAKQEFNTYPLAEDVFYYDAKVEEYIERTELDDYDESIYLGLYTIDGVVGYVVVDEVLRD